MRRRPPRLSLSRPQLALLHPPHLSLSFSSDLRAAPSRSSRAAATVSLDLVAAAQVLGPSSGTPSWRAAVRGSRGGAAPGEVHGSRAGGASFSPAQLKKSLIVAIYP